MPNLYVIDSTFFHAALFSLCIRLGARPLLLGKKSLGDYSHYWSVLDREIERLEVPEEYAGWLADAQCNDCGQTTHNIPFNLVALKCGHCGSYNTSRLSVITTTPSGEQVVDNE
jgi:hypothetical protein